MIQGIQLERVPDHPQQQGVPGLHQTQAGAALQGQRALAQVLPAQERKNLVHLRLEAVPAFEILAARPQAIQQLPQEGLHPLQVRPVRFDEVVVEADGLEGLDEHCGAAGGPVEHESRYRALALLAHRQTGAPVPFHDVGFLEGLRCLSQELLEPVLDRLEAALPFAMEGRELRNPQGIQLAVLQEAPSQTIHDRLGVRQQRSGHLQEIDAQVGTRLRRLFCGPDQGCNRSQKERGRPETRSELTPVLGQGPPCRAEDLIERLIESDEGQSRGLLGPAAASSRCRRRRSPFRPSHGVISRMAVWPQRVRAPLATSSTTVRNSTASSSACWNLGSLIMVGGRRLHPGAKSVPSSKEARIAGLFA